MRAAIAAAQRPQGGVAAQPRMQPGRTVAAPPVIQPASRGGGGGGGGGGGDVAVHNWDKVLCKYGSAGTDIDDAFSRAGYGDPRARRQAILRAIRETGWGASKIAHSLGKEGSGIRGGTIEKIGRCKAAVLEWLQTNPPASGAASAPAGGGRGRARGGDAGREEAEEMDRIRIAQFARWAREGDRQWLEVLRKHAAAGNRFAAEKLAELEPPPPDGGPGDGGEAGAPPLAAAPLTSPIWVLRLRGG